MTSYRHRQISWPTFLLGDALLLLGVILILAGGGAAVVGVILLIVGAVLIPFAALNVSVEGGAVTVGFLVGFPAYRIALHTVEHVEVVRNKSWWGWGLRKIPGGWMYNVYGLDAVELTRRDAGAFRIGTDEPEALAAALDAARAAS